MTYLLDLLPDLGGRESFVPATVSAIARMGGRDGRRVGQHIDLQPMAGAVDREPLLVEQVPDAPYEQDFVMLVVAAVATALDGLELCEFLLPIAEHVWLDGTQVAHLADGEVALGGDGR